MLIIILKEEICIMWSKDKKAPMWEFLGWTFLITIIGYVLLIPVELVVPDPLATVLFFGIVGLVIACSPMYGTYIVLKRHGDISGIREFIKRIFRTPSKKKLYL